MKLVATLTLFLIVCASTSPAAVVLVSAPAMMDAAAIEICGARAEDEIDVAHDQAVFKVLPSVFDQQRVLPSKKPAPPRDESVRLYASRDRL